MPEPMITTSHSASAVRGEASIAGASSIQNDLLCSSATFIARSLSIQGGQTGRGKTGSCQSRLVAEVAHSGEDHRQAGLVGGGDHLLVADRAARLDDRGGARLD